MGGWWGTSFNPWCVPGPGQPATWSLPLKIKGCPVNLNWAAGWGRAGVLTAPNQEGMPGRGEDSVSGGTKGPEGPT